MPEKVHQSTAIPRLEYRPVPPYRLDLEIVTAADLRRRVSAQQWRSTHRYAFHVLVCVTHGTCTHLVDFQPIHCEPGSLLAVRPEQTHNFGLAEDWDGWMIVFRPEFLLPSPTMTPDGRLLAGFATLPTHLSLRDPDDQWVRDAIVQMREDAERDALPQDIHALLRYQLAALVLRLGIVHGHHAVPACDQTRTMQRFQAFNQLVENHFTAWHQVADYAKQLGCAEKSLARATLAAAGINAKAFIAARISLEAKRLLVHTDVSITVIAERLGFGEATNFIKFFKRENGCTPAMFRRTQEAVRGVYGSM